MKCAGWTSLYNITKCIKVVKYDLIIIIILYHSYYNKIALNS